MKIRKIGISISFDNYILYFLFISSIGYLYFAKGEKWRSQSQSTKQEVMILSFSDNLKKAREREGMTQLELAKAIGVSQPTVAQYEKGQILPTIITGVSLARALNTTCEYLVTDRTAEVYDNIIQTLATGNLSEADKRNLVRAWISVQKGSK